MVEIKSERAKKLLERPAAVKTEMVPGMKRFPFDDIKVWGLVEWEQKNVKKLSFFGELQPLEKIFLEALSVLMKDKPLAWLDQISIRECEAFLRDRNSEPAVSGMTEQDENGLKKLIRWLRSFSQVEMGTNYQFVSQNKPFRSLSLVDKIRELKAFLGSSKILTLYQNMAPPELIDVEDLTAYVQVPYDNEEEKSLFNKLHLLGVEAFQEENLNFIPEP